MSLGDLWGRVTASHAWRSWDRYNGSRGNVLAGGVTYLGFFSIIPALALGFAIVGLVVRGKNDLLTSVTDQAVRPAARHRRRRVPSRRPHRPDVPAGDRRADGHRHRRLRHAAAVGHRVGRRPARGRARGVRAAADADQPGQGQACATW
ncbi:hypothetical protein GCM10025868_34870 [Angustibacter aerolatus]|uniref:Uncharacterized protein n=1 Tax=Angustibacter aerolatus TaxID=1162965 RepID=A0ABQ6JKE8_9ACTN|nr:hypothetical protein GCM10025868_34870 [Angustibacter aerolatus]